MKRVIIFVPLVFILAIFLVVASRFFFDFGNSGQGALQVTSNIKGGVYLNDKLLGNTPLCKCKQNETINIGQYSLKIIPDDKSFNVFSIRIKIEKNVMTVVDRTFLPGSLASAYILNLEKINSKGSDLAVVSIPDGGLVSLDGNTQGITPLLLKDISNSEHDLEIQKQGFNKKTIRIRTVPSYKLVVNAILGTEAKNQETVTPTPESLQASPSAMIKIKSTPNGFLRVRETASLSSREIARVLTGEEFPFIEEQSGWFKIKLNTGVLGFVSASFAEKIIKK